MGRIFDLDSPLIRGLNKVADTMWLNILVLIFAIPIIVEQYFTLGPIYLALLDQGASFALGEHMGEIIISWALGIIFSIPLGAALTAMHFVLLKIVREEESYITKTFFRSFKENFKQSSILQMIKFAAGGIIIIDLIIMRNDSAILRYITMAVGFALYLASLYIFPLQSKFENTILGTIKNAFLMSILALPKTIAMGVATAFPILLYYFMDLKIVPLLFLLGIAGPGYVCAVLYNETFKKFEPKEEEVSEEEELENAIKKIDDESDS